MPGNPATPDQHATPGYVILAVDDDPGTLLLAETFFASEGYAVATALSGADALARIDEIAPDIILLDIIMPGMDGFEVCREIRRRPRFKNTPIIVLTSLDENLSALQGVVGAECLLRWRHPDGLRYPDGFIPLAEETGLILPVGDWVLETAISQLSAWADQLPE